MNPTISKWLDHYGMAVVLLVLCVYYSVATFQEQQPRGRDAAAQLAGRCASAAGGSGVLLVGRQAGEDEEFVRELGRLLAARGVLVTGSVLGDPRAARQALNKLVEEHRSLAAIATTSECAGWTLWESLPTDFAALGKPAVLVAPAYRWPTFLKRENLLNVANQIAVVAIMAAGMTVVIITGGIDLSVGSLIALSAVLCTLLIRDHFGGVNAGPLGLTLSAGAGVAVGAATGVFSGLMITLFRVPAFIATLAVMQVASGLAYILAKGNSIYEVPERFTWLGRGLGPFSVPVAVLLMAFIYLAAHFLMDRTVLGRHIYAVGSNVQTARLCGVRVERILVFAYAFCGALAGLGGVILASQLKSGAPTYGLSYELYVIAAVVVGGTSLAGGEGRIFGTFIGALIIAVIQNGMNLTGVESYRQKVVLGLVILGAVLLDMLKKHGGRFWAVWKWKGRTASAG